MGEGLLLCFVQILVRRCPPHICPMTGDVGREGEAEGARVATRGDPWGQQGQGSEAAWPSTKGAKAFLPRGESGGKIATRSLEQLCLGRGVEFSSPASTFSVILAHASCIPAGAPAGPHLASATSLHLPWGVGWIWPLGEGTGNTALGPSSLLPSVPFTCALLGPLGTVG